MGAHRYNPEYHHRWSIRLRDYDYSQGGAYYVTLCTYERERTFGEIVDENVNLSEYGEIVLACWSALPEHFGNTDLDAFVIMHNHLHAILVITETGSSTQPRRPLGTMLGAFKSAVSKRVNDLRDSHGAPVWQRNYYEHVIRNERELNAIREYIANNPENWAKDEHFAFG